MNKLSKSTFNSGNVAAKSRPVSVLQFGEGNFLRAFVDWMLDVLSEKGLFEGSVLAVNNTRRGGVEKLLAQDCLFTVVSRGLLDGRKIDERRVVRSISAALNPYSEWSSLLKTAVSAELRFVVSNTTEAGIVYKPEPFKAGEAQESFPAKCAALLAARSAAFKFDVSKGSLLFLPCELIESNGSALRDAILRHLSDWGMTREAEWTRNSCVFANTLVDRIVPGRLPDEESKALCAELGYEDALLVAAEPFHFWAIEAPEQVWESIPFAKGGLNVVWTKDLSIYRARKVRLLNATHTANVFGACLAGVETVREMMEHPLFGKLARQSLFKELTPTVAMPQAEREAYAASVVERFLNPYIRHELLSITLNSVSKWKVRVLPPLQDFVKANGKLPPVLGFSLSALAVFYKEKADKVKDDPAAVKLIADAWASASNAEDFAARFLSASQLWGADLRSLPGFEAFFVANLKSIAKNGIEKAASSVLGV